MQSERQTAKTHNAGSTTQVVQSRFCNAGLPQHFRGLRKRACDAAKICASRVCRLGLEHVLALGRVLAPPCGLFLALARAPAPTPHKQQQKQKTNKQRIAFTEKNKKQESKKEKQESKKEKKKNKKVKKTTRKRKIKKKIRKTKKKSLVAALRGLLGLAPFRVPLGAL
jgi:hypothetical protein